MIGTWERRADARGTRRCPTAWAASRRAARGRGATASKTSRASSAVAGDLHPEPLPLQADRQRLDEGLLVLDHEHRGLVAMVTRELASVAGADGRRRGGRGRPARRSVNVEPSPSRDCTDTCPPWLVATWRTMARPRPVPPVLAAAGPIDAVEALEDPFEVALAGCRCRGRCTTRSTHRSRRRRPPTAHQVDDRAGIGVLHGVLEQVGQRRHELSALAPHGRGAGRPLVDVDARCRGSSASWRTRSTRLGRPAGRPPPPRGPARPSSSMRRQLEEVVDDAGRRGGDSATMRLGQPGRRPRGRPRRSSVSASRASAPTGVLSSWLMLATKSGASPRAACRSVMSSIDRQAAPPATGAGPHHHRAPGRAVQLEGRGRSSRRRGARGQQLADGVEHQGVGVAGTDEVGGDVVAQHDARRRRPPTTTPMGRASSAASSRRTRRRARARSRRLAPLDGARQAEQRLRPDGSPAARPGGAERIEAHRQRRQPPRHRAGARPRRRRGRRRPSPPRPAPRRATGSPAPLTGPGRAVTGHGVSTPRRPGAWAAAAVAVGLGQATGDHVLRPARRC